MSCHVNDELLSVLCRHLQIPNRVTHGQGNVSVLLSLYYLKSSPHSLPSTSMHFARSHLLAGCDEVCELLGQPLIRLVRELTESSVGCADLCSVMVWEDA